MHPVHKGFSTYFGYIMAGLAFLTVAVGQIAGDKSPLGISPALGAQIGAALAIATAVGRQVQAMRGSVPVRWGLASSTTFGLAAVSGLLLVIGSEANDAFLLGMSPGTMAKITAALTLAVTIGRQAQAAFGTMPVAAGK